jgi:hypothetical protein
MKTQIYVAINDACYPIVTASDRWVVSRPISREDALTHLQESAVARLEADRRASEQFTDADQSYPTLMAYFADY